MPFRRGCPKLSAYYLLRNMRNCIFFFCVFLLFSVYSSAKRVRISIKEDIKKQLVYENTVYICSDIINLCGDTIDIPPSSSIRFKNGKILNGTINGCNTILEGNLLDVFSNMNFIGSFSIDYISYKYFTDYKTDTELLRGMFNLLFSVDNFCILDLEKERKYDVDCRKLSYAHSIYEYERVRNKYIRGNNALINDLRKRSLVGYHTYDGVFLFSDCHNIVIEKLNYQNLNEDYSAIVENGKVKYKAGLENQIGYVGTSFILLQNDCSLFDITADIVGARYGVKSGDYSQFWLCGSYGIKNSKFNITASRTGYPIAIEIGDSLNIFVHSELHHRAAYLCGISNSKIKIEAKDICVAPIHCLLSDTHYSKGDKANVYYKACSNLWVNVIDTGSSIATNGDCFCVGFQTYNNESFHKRKEPLVWENIKLKITKTNKSDKIGLFIFYRDNPVKCSNLHKIKDVFRNILISGEDLHSSSQYALRLRLNKFCVLDNFRIKINAPNSPIICDNKNNYTLDFSESIFSNIYYSGKIQTSLDAKRIQINIP